MDELQIALLIINTIAIIAIPIVAVLIAQKLQDRAAKRKDKIDIFKTLVSSNVYGWGSSYHAVNSLNSIPVIFADDKEVVTKYTDYINSCRLGDSATEAQRKQIETNTIKLLEVMAKVLGYKSEWHVFTTTYLPQGIAKDLMNKRQFEDSQLAVGELAEVALKMFTNQQIQQPQQTVEEQKEKGNGKAKNAK